MQFSLLALGLAALAAANSMPQGVTSAISPSGTAPASCSSSYSGTFEIQVVNVTSSAKRDLSKRQASTVLVLTLADGILKDAQGRTGYIADNQQFQFDAPPQTGAVYTAGWSACSNGSLALGDSAIFYQCLSGTFYNLYDESVAAQCSPVYIEIINGKAQAPASVISDGQVTANPVTQITDGQVQGPTGAPVSQLSDGQIQATTAAGAPVTQISDGQVQATTGSPVTVISDGQPQAPTGNPVTVISDGQPQAPTGNPVSQISDGQPQAPASTGGPTPIINGTTPITPSTAPITPNTNAAAMPAMRVEVFGFAALLFAVALL